MQKRNHIILLTHLLWGGHYLCLIIEKLCEPIASSLISPSISKMVEQGMSPVLIISLAVDVLIINFSDFKCKEKVLHVGLFFVILQDNPWQV
jgi:hypothetical protein